MGELAVVPETFENVFFTHDEVIASCQAVLELVPGAADLGDIRIEIDEGVQTNRVRISETDPLTLQVQSGAFEDTTTPRAFSDLQTKINTGRLLFEALDRADSAFGAPAVGDEISKEARGAWDIYCYGRVARLGYRIHKPRYLYNFHNWVGFSDEAATVFEELWDGEGLSFAELESKVAGLTPTRTI